MIDLHDLPNHPMWTIGLCAVWAWVSITLVVRVWMVHRRARFSKKFLWSFALLVPLFGWVFYGGCFQVPDYHHSPIPPSET